MIPMSTKHAHAPTPTGAGIFSALGGPEAFALAGQCERRRQNHTHGENDAEQTRHDVVLGNAFGIVERMDDSLERWWTLHTHGERTLKIVAQGVLHDAIDGCEAPVADLPEERIASR